MPWFETIKTIEITPEKFVDSCLYDELQEVILLAKKKLSLYNASFHFRFLILGSLQDSLDGGSARRKAAT